MKPTPPEMSQVSVPGLHAIDGPLGRRRSGRQDRSRHRGKIMSFRIDTSPWLFQRRGRPDAVPHFQAISAGTSAIFPVE